MSTPKIETIKTQIDKFVIHFHGEAQCIPDYVRIPLCKMNDERKTEDIGRSIICVAAVSKMGAVYLYSPHSIVSWYEKNKEEE